MNNLDAPTVLLQWSVGMCVFMWVTGRRREVGIGYGWTVRGSALAMAVLAIALGLMADDEPSASTVRDLVAVAFAASLVAALVVSWQRRKVGVAKQRERAQVSSARIIEMTGIDRQAQTFADGPEFPPVLDIAAAAVGAVAVIAASVAAGGPVVLGILRVAVGTLFLGAVSDAMLLGHWYLVQPGLPRAPLLELVRYLGWILPFEVAVMLIPTGMFSVFSGAIDDAYGGMLGWFWAACAITTGGLVIVTRLALKERQYAAVMAATGLLYLAILTAFGTDLVARALLSN